MAPLLCPSLFNLLPLPSPSFIFQSGDQREGVDLTSRREQENLKKKKKKGEEKKIGGRQERGPKTLQLRVCARVREVALASVCARACVREQVGL